MKKKYFLFIVTLLIFATLSCGGNVLTSLSTKDNLQEQAENDMQNGNYSDAQTKLLTLIASNPTNYEAVSLLASCYAAIGGIKLYDILINAATNNSLPNPSSNPVSFSAALLPTPSALIFTQMSLATSTMDSIPSANLTSDMSFLQQMLLDIYLLLQMQDLLTTLRAGGALTNAQVTLIFSTIGNINAAASSGNSNQLTQAISSVTSGINNAPGANQAQQVASFLTPFI